MRLTVRRVCPVHSSFNDNEDNDHDDHHHHYQRGWTYGTQYHDDKSHSHIGPVR